MIKSWPGSIEDMGIPLLPNEPSSNHEDFHEEVGVELIPGFCHHRAKCTTLGLVFPIGNPI
jgi:hypothetical protein